MDLKKEKTLVIVKPDGVKRGLTGEIIQRIEQRGLKVVALKMFQATKEDFGKHYPDSRDFLRNLGEKTLATYVKNNMDAQKLMGTSDPEKIGKEVHKWLVDFMISGPIVKMVVQGLHAVAMVRKLTGATMPADADAGSIRGDFSTDSAALANAEKRAVRNLLHASGSIEEAEKEIALWFKPEEIHDYQRAEESTSY